MQMKLSVMAVVASLAILISAGANAQVGAPPKTRALPLPPPAAQQGKPPPPTSPLPPDPHTATCDKSISIDYIGGAAIVGCLDVKAQKLRQFTNFETDKPSATAVIAFIQPYITMVTIVGSMQAPEGYPAPILGFHRQINLQLDNDKIVGMQLR